MGRVRGGTAAAGEEREAITAREERRPQRRNDRENAKPARQGRNGGRKGGTIENMRSQYGNDGTAAAREERLGKCEASTAREERRPQGRNFRCVRKEVD